MPDASTVLLILLTAPPPEPMHGAVVSAAVRQALGPGSQVVVDERAQWPSDAEAAELATDQKAAAVAEVRWAENDRSKARIHVYLSHDRTFYDHDVTFGAADDVQERERAVGLLVGSMIRAMAEVSPPPPAPGPSAPKPAAAAPAPTAAPTASTPAPPVPAPEASRASAAGGADGRTPSRTPRAGGASAWLGWRGWLVDAGVTGSLGIAGPATGVGPSLHLAGEPARHWLVRAGSSIRFGPIDAADASSTTWLFGAGLSFMPVVGRVTVYLEAEGLAIEHIVARSSPAERHVRWIAGASLAATIGLRLTPAFEPYLGPGLEAAFGPTPVELDGRTLATIPIVRAVAGAGLRIHL